MMRGRRLLLLMAGLVLFAGAFFAGLGIGKTLMNVKLRQSYRESEVEWRKELAAGVEKSEVRDKRNAELSKSMGKVSMKQELYFPLDNMTANADIIVGEESEYGCIVSIIRDATGETLYQSGLIEPGKGIEEITLNTSLKEGWYPCTAVWEFYTSGDEYVGETAWKVVVITIQQDS